MNKLAVEKQAVAAVCWTRSLIKHSSTFCPTTRRMAPSPPPQNPAAEYVVTGPRTALAASLPRSFIQDHHHVAVHGRTKSKVDAVVAEVEQSGGTQEAGRFGSMADVRRLGHEIADAYDASTASSTTRGPLRRLHR